MTLNGTNKIISHTGVYSMSLGFQCLATVKVIIYVNNFNTRLTNVDSSTNQRHERTLRIFGHSKHLFENDKFQKDTRVHEREALRLFGGSRTERGVLGYAEQACCASRITHGGIPPSFSEPFPASSLQHAEAASSSVEASPLPR
jgi:hypothetical protein